jgi:hypothetical protein
MTEGVRINLPPNITATTIIGPSGEPYLVHVDADGTRWIDMSLKDCESMLPNADPSCASWRSANPAAFQRVGGEVRKPEVGINIARYMAAHTAPAPRSPFDKGGQVNDTMRMRRRPR